MSKFLESFPDGSILGDTDYDKVILTYMGEKYECANKRQAIRKIRLLKNREYEKKYRDKWPKKILAHGAVHKALTKGMFEKQPCEICGEIKSEAHHDDYDKPLEVRWLCKACHTEWHMNNKAKGTK